MKRIISTTLLCVLFSSYTNAQLLVDNNGNVRVKNATTSTNTSSFAINGTGDSTISSYIFSNSNSQNIALRIIKHSQVNEIGNTHAVFSSIKQAASSPRKAYGLYGSADKFGGEDTNCGRSFGVYGVAGNSTSGYNYGVFGTLVGSNFGAAVYGSSDYLDGGIDVPGRLAGFFKGDVISTNTISASAFLMSSDYRLKDNIESIETGFADNLMKLNVVKYNLKQRTVNVGDTAKVPINYYTEDGELLQKTHFGLIAQELQEIYPDLVYEGGDGYLSVNYVEIIPLLIGTVQELKSKVDELTNAPTNKKTLKNERTTNIDEVFSTAILYQNNPNPFTDNTSVECVIPNEIRTADLYIYDMNGHQIESRNISQRGNVSVIIEGSSLDAGMYLYSLITDGVVVDTKRMILTK